MPLPPEPNRTEPSAAPGGARRLAIALALASLPAALGHALVAHAAGLHELARAPSPYWIPSQAVLLQGAVPLVFASACVFLLAPGLLLAAALGRARDPWRFLCDGFLLALPLTTGASLLLDRLGASPRGAGFALLHGILLAASAALLLRRDARGGPLPLPSGLLRRAAWALGPPALLLALLAPKFLWEDFNGDGAHAFEAARLTLHQVLPFWTPQHGPVAGYPGTTSLLFLYPTSWFLRLFGEPEAATRLPYLLHLALLAAAALALIESGAARALLASERVALWLVFAAFTLTMGFSATYSPYNSDFALPATQDTMVVACFLSYFACLRAGDLPLAAGWAAATWLTAPNGPLLLVLLAGASVLAARPVPWRTVLFTVAAIAGCLVLTRLGTALLAALGQPLPGGEYSGSALATRFRFLLLTDTRRFLFALVPAGLTAAATPFFWRSLDATARTLLLAAAGSFALFYVQAGVALHHFAPPMLLLPVAFWRWRCGLAPADRWTAAALTGAVVALALCAPVHPEPRTAARRVAATVSERFGGYEELAPAPFGHINLLYELWPSSASPLVPEQSYGGSALAWLHYARHERPGDPLRPETNAVLQDVRAPRPDGFDPVARHGSGVLYVKDRSVVDAQRALRPPTPPGSRLFRIPHEMRFRHATPRSDPRIIDLAALVRRILPE